MRQLLRPAALAMLLVMGMLIVSIPSVDAQSGGAYKISWTILSGGGGASSGGVYALSGTLGQPGAGALTGGGYRIHSGFWVGADKAAATIRIFLPLLQR